MPRKGRGDRDWQRYERDWKGYERYRRDEVNLFLIKAKSLVESNPPPWTPQKIGQPPYPPKAMVILLLLKTWLGMDYRSISAYLRAFPEQSADHTQQGGITKQGSKWLRHVLVEAAMTAKQYDL